MKRHRVDAVTSPRDGRVGAEARRTPRVFGRRIVRGVLAVAVAAVASVVIAPPVASYAGGYGCTGSLVGSWTVTGSEGVFSDIHLYYDSSTGWNCAVNVKRSSWVFYGMATNIYIYMNNSSYDDNHTKNNFASDSGMYKYYAGPVRVYGKNMCIWIEAGDAETSGPNADYWDYDVRDVNRVACG
jgi:hypothetical protein